MKTVLLLLLNINFDSFSQTATISNEVRYTLKINPISSFFEPAILSDIGIKNDMFFTTKIGYRFGHNSTNDQDFSSYNLYSYYSGPVAGIGIRKKWKDILIGPEVIFKYLFINRANVTYEMGERNKYTRYGGIQVSYTLKLLFIKQYIFKFFLAEIYWGGSIKYIDNNNFYILGTAEILDYGGINYSGYSDYKSLAEGIKLQNKKNMIYPMIHFGLNVGLCQ